MCQVKSIRVQLTGISAYPGTVADMVLGKWPFQNDADGKEDDCIPTIDGNACFAAGMSGTMANILRCITQPDDDPAVVLEKVRAAMYFLGVREGRRALLIMFVVAALRLLHLRWRASGYDGEGQRTMQDLDSIVTEDGGDPAGEAFGW